jgi:toxin CptA
MSIAVSVLVRPSRRVRVAVLAFAVIQCGVALALLTGLAGPFALEQVLATLCLLAMVMLLRGYKRAANSHQIDISGLGQIRLTVQQHIGSAHARSRPWRLMPGSTLWPQLMCLRLGERGAAPSVLLVAIDSLAPPEYRALAVAVRDIAGRKLESTAVNKIL